MKRLIIALLGLGLSSACTLPSGSLARPVNPVKDTALVGGTVLVPFAAAGAATFSDDSVSIGTIADDFALIPAGSFDYALSEGVQLGFSLSYFKEFASTEAANGIFFNPRFDIPLGDLETRKLSLTIDGNMNFLSDGGDTGFWLTPTIGIRWYIPTFADGGVIFSQQIGTGFITVVLPGSLAYDVKIGPVHIFPEVRWDPTFIIISDEGLVVSLFSAGLSVMIEL